MLPITVPAARMWDEVKEEFVYAEEVTLELEHSLVSLSKWESKHHKAFLSKREKTPEEELDYIKCMTLTEHVPDEVYARLTQENVDQIARYLEDPMTATYFPDDKKQTSSRDVMTAEYIYYCMFANGIPLEWENRHLNRLIAIIKMCALKNNPPKKMSKNEIASRHRQINAANRAKYHTKG